MSRSDSWVRTSGRSAAVIAALLAAVALVTAVFTASATANAASVISGALFQDLNRNGVQDPGEAPLAGKGVVLLDPSGQRQLAYTASDASGRYSFTGLTDGSYRVELDPYDWWQIRGDWVPTTTGSVWPRIAVNLSGSATADFGWRPIVRSTDEAAPISSYTAPNGLRVLSYDDAVGARELYDDLASGTLIGAEASSVTVRFDLGSSADMCSTSVSGSAGAYSDYSARIDVAYLAWLDQGDAVLFHEYGHAWSLYYAYIAQQSTDLTSYLQARGILGDARLDTSHAWSRRELIAEDYRQLFGTANAAARPQENTELPPAASVPGLRDFLATTFMQVTASAPIPTPTPSPTPTPTPTPTPAPALAVSGVTMSPSPVKTTGTASFSLTTPASVSATIRDAKGALVRTLLQSVAEPTGASTIAWDRKNGAGQRVKSGTYTLTVDAVASGSGATARAVFSVS